MDAELKQMRAQLAAVEDQAAHYAAHGDTSEADAIRYALKRPAEQSDAPHIGKRFDSVPR